jgi:acyl carrier protein
VTPKDTSSDLEARLKQILINRLGIADEEIRLDASLVEDLGMDSLDAVELAIATERQFDVSLSDEQVAKLNTVADLVALIRRLTEQQNAPPTKPGLPGQLGAHGDHPRGEGDR